MKSISDEKIDFYSLPMAERVEVKLQFPTNTTIHKMQEVLSWAKYWSMNSMGGVIAGVKPPYLKHFEEEAKEYITNEEYILESSKYE